MENKHLLLQHLFQREKQLKENYKKLQEITRGPATLGVTIENGSLYRPAVDICLQGTLSDYHVVKYNPSFEENGMPLDEAKSFLERNLVKDFQTKNKESNAAYVADELLTKES